MAAKTKKSGKVVPTMKVQKRYAEIVAQGGPAALFKLLALWQGSLYKLVWIDVSVYLVIYFFLSFIYRFALQEDQKKTFEDVVLFCEDIRQNIPITFILGFFVAAVIGRWWILWESIPLPHGLPLIVEGLIEGHGRPVLKEIKNDEDKVIETKVVAPEEYDPQHSRQLRFHILRYILLGWTLAMMTISEQIKRRFKYEDAAFKNSHQLNVALDADENSINREQEIAAEKQKKAMDCVFESMNEDPTIQSTFGHFVTPDEMNVFHRVVAKYRYVYGQAQTMEYWIPFQWATLLIQKASLQGFIGDEKTAVFLVARIAAARKELQAFLMHGNIVIPLVYTQVVIIVVHTYFLTHVFAGQFVNKPIKGSDSKPIDMYVPIFDTMVFLFLMGWLRVAFCVMNPFGADDEDFDLSDMLDNLVDRCHYAIESSNYPTNLPRAPFSYMQNKNFINDNLREFLDDTDAQLRNYEKFEQESHKTQGTSAGIRRVFSKCCA